MTGTDAFEVSEAVRHALEEALRRRGRANILIAGRTGVGKSTLINAVFQGNLATTGDGRPVTMNTREIRKEGIPVSIFDTRGLELAEFEQTFKALEALVVERRCNADPHQHIHIAWICISEDSRRVEEAESKLCAMLAKYVPVIAIITKARADQGFRVKAQQLLPETRNVVSVLAVREELDEGHVLQPKGLAELVNLTMELLPEGQRNAFAAAEKVDVEFKRRRARGVVAAAVLAAAATAATPIPFSDAFVLVPIQIGMLTSITAIFGVPLGQGFLSALIASAATSLGATVAGRSIVAGLLKLLPGVGTAAGATISAVTASTLTEAFGEAYIATLTLLFARNGGETPTEAEIISTFKEQLIQARRAS